MQIGDMRGLGGLVLTLWHELKIKVNIYNVKVQPAALPPSVIMHSYTAGCIHMSALWSSSLSSHALISRQEHCLP